MDIVRYKPADVIRWLAEGAGQARSSAVQKAQKIPSSSGVESLKHAAGAALDLGRSVMAGLAHQVVEGTEYTLFSEEFEVCGSGRTRRIRYNDVQAIELKSGEKATLKLASGDYIVKPVAYVSAGRWRAPVGWKRNEMEVPFSLLIEELAARCGLKVSSA